MFLAGSKKLKTSLALSVFLGLIFSFSCTFFHHPAVSAHASTHESTAVPTQNNETCCGTGLSKSDHSLKEIFLTLPKNHARDLYDVLVIGLMFVSAIIASRLFKHTEQRLAYFVWLYIKQHLEIFAFHYLRLVFSRGILNSKKYNVAFN